MPRTFPEPAHILVRSVNWLGDAVMTTPALRRLRECFPQARITLLAPAKLAGLWQHQPDISDCVALPESGGVWAAGKLIRTVAPDLALILPNSPRSALEAWLGRVPRRIGYARPWRNWLLTTVVPARPDRIRMRKRSVAEIQELIRRNVPATVYPLSAHQTNEYLELVAALGASPAPCPPRLAVTEDELREVREKFLRGGPSRDGRVLIGLNPGAEYGPAKRWPVERFAEVAKSLADYAVFLILGGKGDVALAGELEQALQAARAAYVNAAGRTTLRELCALLRCCRVLLTNDTGPMHLAAALGTPVVVPFGSTSPELTGPGEPGSNAHRLLRCGAPCSPCFLRECPIDFRCMTGITAESVRQAVAELAGLR